MVRQTVLLKRILGYFVTPTQLREYESLVKVNKGSASHMAMRLIERYFEYRDRREHPERHREDFAENKPTNGDRMIRVNSRSGSYFL